MLVSVAKTLIFLPIILIQRADCGSNLPVVPYGRKWFLTRTISAVQDLLRIQQTFISKKPIDISNPLHGEFSACNNLAA